MKQIYIYIYIYIYIFDFQQFGTMRSFGDSIYIGKFSTMRQKWIEQIY